MTDCTLCVSHDVIETKSFVTEQAKDIILPYYREITNVLPSPVPRANYNSSHLYCLKKNIFPFINNIDPAYDINFSTKENGNSMVVTLDIYKGGDRVVLNDSIIHTIESNLHHYIDLYPYCLVYDVSYGEYPEQWLTSILPRLRVGIYRTGSIFIDIDSIPNYITEWEQTYNKINDMLSDYYKRGVIALDSVKDKTFIDKWNLVPVLDGLYEPKWKYNFTNDKVNFLMNQPGGVGQMMLYIGENNNVHTYEGWLIKSIRDYKEASDTIDSIFV